MCVVLIGMNVGALAEKVGVVRVLLVFLCGGGDGVGVGAGAGSAHRLLLGVTYIVLSELLGVVSEESQLVEALELAVLGVVGVVGVGGMACAAQSTGFRFVVAAVVIIFVVVVVAKRRV